MRRALVLLVVALAGCATPEAPPGRATIEPPVDGGGFAPCAPPDAYQTATPMRARSVDDARGLDRGLHRLDDATILWVWGSFAESLHEDRVTRVNEVRTFRDAREPLFHVCASIDVATPTQVDDRPRTFDVAVLIEAPEGLPATDLRVVVNWVAGCPCDPLPRGNDTAVWTL